MATIRRIILYKTFINKQIDHKYEYNNKAGTIIIFYNIVQPTLGSSHKQCTQAMDNSIS